MENHPIVRQWLQKLEDSKTATDHDVPNYWSPNFRFLTTKSNIHGLTFGTGHSIYTNSILPAIATAESEVILVTCFWARSPTLDNLNATLIDLSAKALRTGKKIRVRICFSSLSIFQKLFHTASLEGRVYSPPQWRAKLGLPAADELEGLEMEVKSIFVRPFSVMHPKFVIVDRQRVFLPSCNVSWEDWFEGCVELSGSVVGKFVEFWARFWSNGIDRGLGLADRSNGIMTTAPATPYPTASFEPKEDVQSIFLPSPHHRNPRFALLPWRPCPAPPPTPLNVFLLSAFANARKDIYIQTPNLTAPPVLSALLAVLKRGINVTILTSERLMILEQLITAGTTTSRCVKKLIKRHKKLVKEWQRQQTDPTALEAGQLTQPGKLTVYFYQPYREAKGEPTQSHLKLTIVDSECVVLGSGNMDRASWYTSQELGVAFFCRAFAAEVRKKLDAQMKSRRRYADRSGYGG